MNMDPDAALVSEAELQEIERLDAAATPGPWMRSMFEDGDSGEGPFGVYPGSRGDMVEGNDVVTEPTEDEPEGRAIVTGALSGHDAAFIARARTLLSRLVAEVRRLTDELASESASRGAEEDAHDADMAAMRAEVTRREEQEAAWHEATGAHDPDDYLRSAEKRRQEVEELRAELDEARTGDALSEERTTALWHALDALEEPEPAWKDAMRALASHGLDSGPIEPLRKLLRAGPRGRLELALIDAGWLHTIPGRERWLDPRDGNKVSLDEALQIHARRVLEAERTEPLSCPYCTGELTAPDAQDGDTVRCECGFTSGLIVDLHGRYLASFDDPEEAAQP